LTPNFGWTKPDPGASASTWGATLNATTDKVDAQCFANQQSGVPIGSGALWFTATPPTNWLICNGSSLSTAAPYDKLFAAIGYTYGGSGANFNLPSLVDKFPIGAGSNALAASGGAATVTLDTTMVPPHAHPIVDLAHNHSINQSPHNHGDPTHTHGASAGDSGTHAHGSNLMRFVGSGGSLGVGTAPNNVSTGNTDAANAPGVNVTVNAAGTGIQANTIPISLNASGTGLSTTQNTGGGVAHNNMPPFVGINFIIKYA
jgi:microcystin-dependent protein